MLEKYEYYNKFMNKNKKCIQFIVSVLYNYNYIQSAFYYISHFFKKRY